MKRFFLIRIIVFLYLLIFSSPILAEESNKLNNSSFLYDNQGNPKFLKITIKKRDPPYSDVNIYYDDFGPFILVPFYEGFWVCPFCGNLNYDFIENCRSQNCY
jgi:hypothetical protein